MIIVKNRTVLHSPYENVEETGKNITKGGVRKSEFASI